MTSINNLPIVQKVQTTALYQKVATLPPLGQKLVLVGSVTFLTSLLLAIVYVFVDRIIAIGALSSILAGLATGLGAIPVLFYRQITHKTLNAMLGGAAGVMLAATAFSLIVPGIQYGNDLWPGKGVYVVAIGIMIGAGFLVLADQWLPYEKYLEKGESFDSLRKVWLFIAAVTLHNLPEGGAVGVSFGAGDWHNGVALAMAVALQNIPEGMAVATLTGLIEPIGGVMGVVMAKAFLPLMPIGMAFAAGAMLFVISDDIIPETQSRGKARYATFAMMGGFILMMILDNLVTT